MARPAFLVCGRLRGFGTAQYPRALRRYREAVCRGCAHAANARNGGGRLRSKSTVAVAPCLPRGLSRRSGRRRKLCEGGWAPLFGQAAPVSRLAQRGGYLIRTARVLSSRRTWPERKESIILGSTIFFPSSCTLPCLIKRL